MKRTFSKTLNLLLEHTPEFLKSNGAVNVTQAGKQIGINQATLKRMCDGDSGQPKEDNLAKLRKYYKLSTDQLMGISPIPWLDGETVSEYDELIAKASRVDDLAVREEIGRYIDFQLTELARKRDQ
ncbi:MAG: hypothetical protein ACRBCS_02990 [Cellvibrionaceae bacterium]